MTVFESLTINETLRTVSRDGHSIYLTPVEYKLFYALYFADGHPIDRIKLNEKAYPDCATKYTHWNYASSKVILCKLRKKVVALGLLIETTRLKEGKNTGRPGLYRLVDLEEKPHPLSPLHEEKVA